MAPAGYTSSAEPYHGYFFKILKGQGPAVRLGQMDFVVNGIMIGGFALVAAPAEYDVTGVRTFIVSHDGVVYEKDLGSRNQLLEQCFRRCRGVGGVGGIGGVGGVGGVGVYASVSPGRSIIVHRIATKDLRFTSFRAVFITPSSLYWLR